jgi:hypothetical protein
VGANRLRVKPAVCWRRVGAPAQLCWSWDGHRPDHNWHVNSRHTWSNVTGNEMKFTVLHKTVWLCESKERLSKVAKRTICGLVQNCLLPPSPKIHTVHVLTADGPSQTVSVSLPAQTITYSNANSVEIPVRRSFVIEFIIPKFVKGSTCFERHTAHHQEL